MGGVSSVQPELPGRGVILATSSIVVGVGIPKG